MNEQAQLDVVLSLKDNLSGKMAGVTKNLSSMGDQFASVGSMAMKGLAVAGAGLSALAAVGIKGAADFEQTRISMETMLGSAEKAGSILKDISSFAAATPFEFPELANSAKQLLAFGFTADESMKSIKMLGDVSAGLNIPMSDLSYLFGTLKAQGKAMTIDIRQFAMRGIPIYETLAKVMKTSVAGVGELVTAGKVGFPEVNKAFELMTAEGGKFGGLMAKQSQSLSGLYSTLKDNIGFALREIIGINTEGTVRDGSIFDILRKSAGSFIEWITANQANIIAFFTNLVTAIQTFASNVQTYLGPVFSAIVGFFSDMENRRALFIATLAVLTVAIAAWAVTTIIAMAPITLMILALGVIVFAFTKAWNENFLGMRDIFLAVWNGMKSFYDGYIVPLWKKLKEDNDKVMEVWRNNWDNIKWIFQGAWQAIVGIFQIAWAVFSGVFKVGIDIFTGNWSKAMGDVGAIFSGAWTGIKNVFQGVAKSLMGIMSELVNYFIRKINSLIDKANKIPGIKMGKIGEADMGDVPSFAVGANYIPRDMIAQIHEGEMIVPKAFNPAAGGSGMGGGSVTIQINGDNHFNNDTDINMLVDKIEQRLSRKLERAAWGMA
jgi:hypothetical protein